MDSFTFPTLFTFPTSQFPTLVLNVVRIMNSSFPNFLPEQVHSKGEWEVAVSEISYPSLHQNVTEGKFTFVYSRKVSEEKKILYQCMLN